MSRRATWAVALGLIAASACGGCEYRPRNELLYPREETPPPPPVDLGADADPVDPGAYAVFDRHCQVCHPGYGTQRSDSGPELAGVLRHNSRAVTERFSRFGGGEMDSLEALVDEEQAAALVDILATYGEGFEPPATGDAQRGAALFELACAGCHLDGGAREQIIPDLRGLGARLSDAFLDDLLDRATGAMPAVALSQAERLEVKTYLAAVPAASAPPAAPAAFVQRCEGCHVAGGTRNLRVPTTGQGGATSPAGLRQLCVEGQGEMPGVLQALEDAAALDLQAYLRSVRPQRPAPTDWPPVDFAEPDATAAARGEAIYRRDCLVCHGSTLGEARIWPHLRDAGYLHSRTYLMEISRDGGGEMPGYAALGEASLGRLADYLLAMAREAHGGAARVAPEPLFVQHCEGCHQDGGRQAAIVPVLGQVARDLSAARFDLVLASGFGAMARTACTVEERADLLAYFRQGLGRVAAAPQLVAAGQAAFGQHCAACHVQEGRLPLRVPALGDLLGRASEAYVDDLVQEGRGLMPAQPAAVAQLASLRSALGQAARAEPVAAAGQAAWDGFCAACHGSLALGDETLAATSPSHLVGVAGRLSPAFLDSVSQGRGAMVALPAAQGVGALLLPYLETLPALGLLPDSWLPAGGAGGGAARETFDRLCGECHADGGQRQRTLPPIDLRLTRLSESYVVGFIDAPYGEMARVALNATERGQVLSYCAARRGGRTPGAAATETYVLRCGGCHPASPAEPALTVPALVDAPGRISGELVVDLSLRGGGQMAPAYTPEGNLPQRVDVEATFAQIASLDGRAALPHLEPTVDAAAAERGRGTFTASCGGVTCHDPRGFDLAVHTEGGREVVPLQYLSAELLAQVTRAPRSSSTPDPMPDFPSQTLSDAQLADVVQFLLHLGRGGR